jgi:hypothetical protein
VQNLNEYVQGSTAELVFNLDEVGISDWEDRKARKIVVPAALCGRRDTIHHGISRKAKHISVIACVFVAEESLTPDNIASQDSPSDREQLKKHDVRFRTDLIMKSNAKRYISAEIFLDYVQTVFLSNLAELRRLDEFAEEMAVLLMDNCPSHISCVVMGSLFSPRHECAS